MEQTPQLRGVGFAELPIPLSIRLARFLLWLLTGTTIVATGMLSEHWRFLKSPNAGTLYIVFLPALVLVALILSWRFIRGKFCLALFNLRKLPAGNWVFGAGQTFGQKFQILLLLFCTMGMSFYFSKIYIQAFPLAHKLRVVTLPAAHGNTTLANSAPIFFWDYGVEIEAAQLEQLELLLPYEKSPPEKLLPKIFFRDKLSQRVVLELHAKRPRNYSTIQIKSLFTQLADQNTAMLFVVDTWKLLLQLQTEAGLKKPAELNYFENEHKAIGIGSPYVIGEGSFFFLSEQGNIFQVRCPQPCAAAEILDSVQFVPDPKSSTADRVEWTKKRIQTMLVQLTKPTEKSQDLRKKLLILYLASYLSLDPRDPEAFFHLGKLAENRTTVLSALRYGRDVGLEQAKIMELQATADAMESH